MFAPRQPLSTWSGTVPLALVWEHPTGRFAVEIPFRVLSHWREFFVGGDVLKYGLLTARRRSLPHEASRFLLDFEPLAAPAPLAAGDVNHWSNRHPDRLVVGLVTSNMVDGVRGGCASDIRNLLTEFAEPHLVLTARREGDHTIASLFSWAARVGRFDATYVTFPLDWYELESQNYAPFRPVFFEAPGWASIGRTFNEGDQECASDNAQQVGVSWPAPLANHSAKPVPCARALQTGDVDAAPPSRIPALVLASVAATCAIIALAGYGNRGHLGDRSNGPKAMDMRTAEAEHNASGLDLSAFLSRAGLDIQWNAGARGVKAADSGRVEIRDGRDKVVVLLDRTQLTLGRVLYIPRSPDVQISLQLVTPSGIVGDAIRVLQPHIQAVSPSLAPGRALSEAASHWTERDVKESVSASTQPKRGSNEVQPSHSPVFTPSPPHRQAHIQPSFAADPPQIEPGAAMPVITAFAGLKPADLMIPPPTESTAKTSSAGSAQSQIHHVAVIPPTPLTNLSFNLPPDIQADRMPKGIVALKIYIDESGAVTKVNKRELSIQLAAFTERTVRSWKFAPATRGGKPIPSEMTIRLEFPTRK